MTTKLFASGAARAMFPSSPTLPLMLRGPTITYAEDDDTGGGGNTETGGSTQGAGGGDDTLGGGGGDDNLGGDDTEAGDDSGSDSVLAGGGEDTVTGGEGDDDLGDGKPARVPWQNRRIDKLTATNAQKDEEIARLKRERDALVALGGDTTAGGGGTDTTTSTAGPKTYTEEEVDRRAAEKATLRVLNEKVDGLYDAAAALDPKFESRLPALRTAAGDALSQRPDFWRALTRFDNGAAVMNELTKDLDQLTDLLEMGPVDLGIELAKLAGAVGKGPPAPKISKVPAPPGRITETRTPESDLLALDDDAFAERRAAERAAHREKQR